MVDLTVQLLAARCGVVFGRGFRLRAIGQQLYVQITGRKVPLYLAFDADPQQVQERANALRRFLEVRLGRFDTESWKELCWGSRVRKGKNEKPRLDLEEVSLIWGRLKRAEGISEDTLERHYMSHLRRLDPLNPLSKESLLQVIERTDPRSPTRKRVVAFLRKLCVACGAEWDGLSLDPLQNAGRGVSHRPQAFFSDESIEALLSSKLHPSWRRVLTLLALYGLRPWEAWIAEPCKIRPECLWVPAGKVNRHGEGPPRRVPPFHPEWVTKFEAMTIWKESLPALANRSRAGARVNEQLVRLGMGQTSYGFRHAYARRLHSPRYRVTDAHGAAFMGHTVAAHHKAYRSWLAGDPVEIYLGEL